MGEVALGGVREGRGDELLLGGEVVEHQGVADAQGGGDIGDAHGRGAARLDLLDGGAQQLLAPLGNVQSDSCHLVTLLSPQGVRTLWGTRSHGPLTARNGGATVDHY